MSGKLASGTVWLTIERAGYSNVFGKIAWDTEREARDYAKLASEEFKTVALIEVPWTEGQGL